MKLVYIVNARIPTEKAHGVQIMKMCEAFSRQPGLDVTLVVPRRRGLRAKDPFAHYGISTRFRIVYVPVIDTYLWGRAGFIFGSLTFALSSFLYGLLRRGADVIFYSRDQDNFSFMTFFLALRPYFFEVHGLKRRDWLHRRLFSRISGVVATNSFILDGLVRNFPQLQGRTILLPNGADIEALSGLSSRTDACAKLGLDPSKKHIVYAGHFYAWKGVDALVRAAASLPDGFEVHMVGGNAEETARLCRECPEGAARAHFLGYQPFASMPLWYAAADTLVITGTAKDADSVHYTSPIKLFEYMAAGKPIVAVDSPAVRDIVSDDEAFFYKPDDAASLAATIERAADGGAEAARKANNARAKAPRYSWSVRAASIARFISEKVHE